MQPSRDKQNRVATTAIFIATLFFVSFSNADEESETRQKLQQVSTQISALQNRLKRFHQEKSQIQQDLRKSETAIGRVQKNIVSTRKKLQQKRAQLDTLKSQRRELKRAQKAQQVLIEREIKTAYQMGRQSQIKVLLNQEDPHTVARAMAYYEYFGRARQERMDNYLNIIKKIDAIEPEITETAATLASDEAVLTRQLDERKNRQQQRKDILAKINSDILSNDAKLAQLKKNRAGLEALLEAVEQAVANMEIPENFQSFSALKGQMLWPVEGKARNRFGQMRSGGPLRWQGLMINAKEGSPVRAIHHGRVVYADWFRGSGLLLIIDHGEGFMSLYAHNQSLHREVGEWVTANEIISTVGNSGGQFQSALYFEIRQQGKPTDPGKWCKHG